MWPLIFLLITLLWSSSLHSSAEGQKMEEHIGGGMHKMTFSAPELSEEEQYAIHMPDQHKCDGCMAISYTLHMAFDEKHRHHSKDPAFVMDHGQVLDIFGKCFFVCVWEETSACFSLKSTFIVLQNFEF